MFPHEYRSSYKRYKESTNKCVSWISETAHRLGYLTPARYVPPKPIPVAGSSTATTASRLKGKNRKGAKTKHAEEVDSIPEATDKAPNVLPVSLFLMQASFVSKQSAHITMPSCVRKHLLIAIDKRDRCSEWHSQHDQDNEKISTVQHKFFTSALKKVLSLFPHVERVAFDVKVTTKPIPNPTRSSPEVNQFSRLTIEDLESGSEPEYETYEETSTSAKPKPSKTNVSYELDISAVDDLVFQMWCFLEDANKLDEYLARLWREHAAGKLELQVAALMSNLVFEIVQKEENALLDLVKLLPDSDKTVNNGHFSISSYFVKSKGDSNMDNGVDYLYRNESAFLRDGVFFDQHGFPYRDKLDDYCHEQCCRHLEKPSELTKALLQSEPYRIIAQMILDLKFLLLWPTYRQVFFAERDGTVGPWFSKKTHHYIDEITKTLDESNKCTIGAAFTVRVLLDIHHVLGLACTARYDALRAAGNEAKRLMRTDKCKCQLDAVHVIEFFEGIRANVFELGSSEALCQLIFTHGYITHSIEQNVLGSAKALSRIPELRTPRIFGELIELAAETGCKWEEPCACCSEHQMAKYPDRVYPSLDSGFFHKWNPVYCGIEKLRLELSMEVSGIVRVAGLPQMILAMHLYNMLKQLIQPPGFVPWEELEKVMEGFKSELFHGSYPETPNDIVKRYMLCAGAKASWFVPTSRNQKRLKNLPHPPIIKASPISQCLRDYIHRIISPERLLHELSEICRGQKSGLKRQRVVDDFLNDLNLAREALEEHLPQARWNYFTLHRKCNQIVEKVTWILENFHDIVIERSKLTRSPVYDGANILKYITGGEPYSSSNSQRIPAKTRPKLLKLLGMVFDSITEEDTNWESWLPLVRSQWEEVQSGDDKLHKTLEQEARETDTLAEGSEKAFSVDPGAAGINHNHNNEYVQ